MVVEDGEWCVLAKALIIVGNNLLVKICLMHQISLLRILAHLNRNHSINCRCITFEILSLTLLGVINLLLVVGYAILVVNRIARRKFMRIAYDFMRS